MQGMHSTTQPQPHLERDEIKAKTQYEKWGEGEG